MSGELVIYTDESVKDGRYYSDFYGGVLIRSRDLAEVLKILEDAKRRLNLHQEVKWQKVTENYLSKYQELMGVFFDLVASDVAKIRVMFTQNRFVPRGLTPEQRKLRYHLLYYQFLKHAFGLPFADEFTGPVGIRLNLDQLPDNREANAQFKSYLLGLNHNPRFRRVRISLRADQIAKVTSHDHAPLQCLDVVLGAMAFRLNEQHRVKPPGHHRRGRRTIAKEKLYRFLRSRICEIYPNFNIGETTGKEGDWRNLWRHPYRHWKFVPNDHEIDESRSKSKRKK